jgi:hypothetical protein
MEQRARTHADLDAMLIGQKSVPKGCRVLNVSPQGMMLQCEPDGRLLTFRDSDLVDIHLTVQHGGGRKKFAIPAIVNRVDIKSIDVVFQHPNSELLKLIEAYRISDAHMMEASIALSPHEGYGITQQARRYRERARGRARPQAEPPPGTLPRTGDGYTLRLYCCRRLPLHIRH